MKQRLAKYGIVIAALLFGVCFGFLLVPEREPEYPFVAGARPIRVAEYVRGSTRGILRIFNVRMDWRALLGMAEQTSPMSVVETGNYHGLLAGTVVVPQVSSGRAQLFDTPMREITVIRGKFIRSKSGVEIPRPSDGTWAGVRVIEFRQPQFIDSARQWIQDRLRV